MSTSTDNASARFQALIAECESLIREGRAGETIKRLQKIDARQVPRAFRLPLANLCRRSGLTMSGMRLLAPLVISQHGRRKFDARPEELAEYAVLLIRSGAIDEALLTLEKVKRDDVAESSLYRAFCYQSRWEYDKAVPCLEDYLKAPLAPYAKIVGQVNLAAAYLSSGEALRATELIGEIVVSAEEHGAHRLLGNALEIRAQARIEFADFSKAHEDLDRAAKVFSADPMLGMRYVRKWKSFLEALRTRSTEPLTLFRVEAAASGDWESVREADLCTLRIRFEQRLFEHLYFGSPWAGFRRRISSYLYRKPSCDVFLTSLSGGVVVDLARGAIEDQEADTLARSPRRLLQFLASDFYRPQTIGAVFSALFPGEVFSVYSTPGRVHQVMHRVRSWIKENGLAIELREAKRLYSVERGDGIVFKVPLEQVPNGINEERFSHFSQFLAVGATFTMRELRDRTGLSESVAKRLLRSAVEKGIIERYGAGPRACYCAATVASEVKNVA